MNNLNYCFRNLLKNRGNSVTRLVSLALGLMVALLICSYVGLNLSYGRFFPEIGCFRCMRRLRSLELWGR